MATQHFKWFKQSINISIAVIIGKLINESITMIRKIALVWIWKQKKSRVKENHSHSASTVEHRQSNVFLDFVVNSNPSLWTNFFVLRLCTTLNLGLVDPKFKLVNLRPEAPKPPGLQKNSQNQQTYKLF